MLVFRLVTEPKGGREARSLKLNPYIRTYQSVGALHDTDVHSSNVRGECWSVVAGVLPTWTYPERLGIVQEALSPRYLLSSRAESRVKASASCVRPAFQ
jgi:hypothetical protein